ncbi:MAG: hypothetical protein OXB84_02615 [Halobacteriovoraceae bacterium]|nr:hypothetical protein [Halobacteriovoraceae bacterium]
MISLALIGKDISHSKSQYVYEKILKKNIKYSLIDCSNENDIPNLDILFKKFNGISITSPYKNFFFNKVISDKISVLTGSINCLKMDDNISIATNTDYCAINLQLEEIFKEYELRNIFILGDGCMSRTTQKVLDEKGFVYTVFSRKKKNIYSLDSKLKNNSLIINCCSRNFIYKDNFSKDTVFLDCNYDFSPHQEHLPSKLLRYIDGHRILELQALFSLKFWKII